MKKSRVVGAAGVSAVILVTVIVYKTYQDSEVVVETPDQRVELGAGESRTFSSGGPIEVAASNTPTSSPVPAVAPGNHPDPDAPGPGMTRIRGRVQNVERAPLAGAVVEFKADRDGEVTTVARAECGEEGEFELEVEQGLVGIVEASLSRYSGASLPWSQTAPDEPATDEASQDDPEAAVGEELLLILAHETAIAGRVLLPDGDARPEKYLVGIERYYDMYRRGEPRMRTFENEDGRFYFAVKPGKYRVWSYARGFFRSAEQRVAPIDGQMVEVDFSLSAGVGLTGQVFSKRTGEPIAGAIAFAPLEHLPGSVDRMGRNRVDAEVANAGRSSTTGAFELDDLPPGRHLIRILHPDYIPQDVAVTLEKGATPHIELALEEGFGIRGKVLGGNGEPYDQAMVMAFVMSLNPAAASQSRSLCQEDGSYYIQNLIPGPYIVVMIRDYEEETAETVETVVEMVTHHGGADTQKDFLAIPEDATLRGKVVDVSGNPVSAIQVTATKMSADSGGFTFKTGRSDATGHFEILNLELGTYSVGLSRTYGENFAVAGEVNLKEPIDYEEDFTFHDLHVEGTVRSRGDRALLKNAEVILFRVNADGDNPTFSGRAISDDDGRFILEGLPPGSYRTITSADGYRHSQGEPFELDDALHKKATIEVLLDPGAAVTVTVTDEAGAPIPGALVKILNGQGFFINQGLPPRTDGRGIYTFARLSPGTYTVEVSHEDGTPVRHPFTAEGTAPVPVNVTLSTKD